jgi:hypothetical protein
MRVGRDSLPAEPNGLWARTSDGFHGSAVTHWTLLFDVGAGKSRQTVPDHVDASRVPPTRTQPLPARRSPRSELLDAERTDWTEGQSPPTWPAFASAAGFRRLHEMRAPNRGATRRNCRKTPAQRQRAGVRRVSSFGRAAGLDQPGARFGGVFRERAKLPTGESGVFVLSTACLRAILAASRRPAAQSLAQRANPFTTRGSRLHASHEEPVESGVRPLRSEPAPPCVGLWKTRGARAIFRHAGKIPAGRHAIATPTAFAILPLAARRARLGTDASKARRGTRATPRRRRPRLAR